MPYKPTIDTALHALDPLQLAAAQKGYAWLDGCSVSLSSATSVIETILQPGTVSFDEETISIGNVTVEHQDGDLDFPRWDAVCVTDRTGTVEAISGLPAEPITLGDGTTLRGERAWKPAPPDAVTDEMVCLALVWIPSGATANSDLTDTSNGGVPEPIRDRRIEHEASVSHTTRRAIITSSGWKRIAGLGALSPGGGGAGRAAAKFSIRDTQTGLQSTTTVNASVMFSDPALTLQNSTAFVEPHGAIEGVRLVTGGTNDGAALDVNVQLNGQTQVDFVEYSMQENWFEPGWTPMEFETASVPSGYETATIDMSGVPPMIGAVGQAGKDTQWSVNHNGVMTTDILNRENVGARVSRGAAQNPPAGSGVAPVKFDVVQYDDNNEYNLSTFQFEPRLEGVYEIQAVVTFVGGADVAERLYVQIQNTATGTTLARNYAHKSNSAAIAVEVGDKRKLTQSDRIQIQAEAFESSNIGFRTSHNATYCTFAHLG